MGLNGSIRPPVVPDLMTAEPAAALADMIFADTEACPVNEELGTAGANGILTGVARNIADVHVFKAVFMTDFLGPFQRFRWGR